MVAKLWLFAFLFSIAGCSAARERAIVAQDAQTKMVGLSKEQVLSCMGVPAAKAAEGQTEVWTYNSGNGRAVGVALSGSETTFATSSRRYCIVSIVMTAGKVSRVNYAGPTGGLITGGEQCAFAVQNCVQ